MSSKIKYEQIVGSTLGTYTTWLKNNLQFHYNGKTDYS